MIKFHFRIHPASKINFENKLAKSLFVKVCMKILEKYVAFKNTLRKVILKAYNKCFCKKNIISNAFKML